ncbi:MAG: hypothetical protein ACI4SG_05140 [Oligosphaeraceae bacterium]
MLIPTREEAEGLPPALPCATGFGPGKTAACAAVAKLLFQDRCDAILVWGTAGALKRTLPLGGLMVADKVAYSDYDVSPLYGSDGLGFVPRIAEQCWMPCDSRFNQALARLLPLHFPSTPFCGTGLISAGDVFDNAKYYRADNRIEARADAVDMESPAVVHFCRLMEPVLGRRIPVAIVRYLSNYIGGAASEEFRDALPGIQERNPLLPPLLRRLEGLLEADAAP